MRSTASLLTLTASVLPFLDGVSAHGHVRGLTVNGNANTWVPGADPVWYYLPANQKPVTAGWNALNQDNGFVEPSMMGTSDVNCHKSATPGGASLSVNAGEKVNFYWNTWPDSHKGPIINYIAPVNDFSSASAGSLRWSKINQEAYISGNTWATDVMMKNNFTASVTIPKNLKAGNYVIRHEIIALHGAQNDNGAQLYPQCLNIKVGGSGSVAPTNGVAGTSLYRRNEPGIIFNLYTAFTSYTFPGPALWTAAN